jgi:hypothetical protein
VSFLTTDLALRRTFILLLATVSSLWWSSFIFVLIVVRVSISVWRCRREICYICRDPCIIINRLGKKIKALCFRNNILETRNSG